MGCTSSKFIPWAGRNEITQAAKFRKKAAKEILASYRAYSGCHSSYLDSLKVTGHNLSIFLGQEDKGLLNTAPPMPSQDGAPKEQEPSTYQTSWSKTPGAFDEQPVLEEATEQKEKGANPGFGESAAPGKVPPPAQPEQTQHDSIYGFSGKAEHFAGQGLGMPKETPVGPPQQPDTKAGDQSSTALVPRKPNSMAMMPITYAGHTAWQPAPGMENVPRGAGLAQLGLDLQAMCNEVEQATRPVTEMLSCGMAKSSSALPPIPGMVPGYPQPSLWEILEVLVAYEQQRSRDIKAMEKTKWEHARNSGKLAKQARKQVSAEKQGKHQEKINRSHTKVQQTQGSIARLEESVANITRCIDTIKANLLLPALCNTLPNFMQCSLYAAQIHDRQRQLVAQIVANDALANRHTAGAGVLFTQKNHQVDTEALLASLEKLEQVFCAENAAQKKFLHSIVMWLKCVDPRNAAVSDKAVAAPQAAYQQSQPTGGQPPEQGQMIQFQEGLSLATINKGGPEVVGQFLGNSVSGGEPLLALCNDWLRATDKLTEKSVRDALESFMGWIKEVINKQALEMKQNKKLEDTQKQMLKAEQKYDALLKKEREMRATLAKPSDMPMSRALSMSMGSPIGGPLSLPATPQPAPPPEGMSNGSIYPTPETNALQTWQPQGQSFGTPGSDNPVDRIGAKALAKEQAKEVKAFQTGKEVDLAKGVLEGLKLKVREEQAALESMALDARVTAVKALEKALPNMFQAMAAYCAVTSQMYGMLQHQHGRAWAQLR